MLRYLLERIDAFLVFLAGPFGVNVVSPGRRYGLLLGVYAVIALIAAVGPPLLGLAVLIYGLIGIFAVQRAWKVNEDRRVAIYRNLTTGKADDLPDLRGFALLSALQLLLIFPLLFRALQQTFHIFKAGDEAGFGSWFAFSFDRFCKSLLDWSEIYGVHFTEITALGVHGQHWIMFKSLTIDIILIQAGLRLLQIFSLRREAIEALPRDPLAIVRLGRRALAPLLQTLDHPDSATRLGAIRALGHFPDTLVRDRLLVIAKDTSQPADHRAMAVLSLGEQGNPDVAPALRELTRDPDASVRAAAIEALGRFADPAQFEWFMRIYLEDAAPEVRRAVLGVLERLAEDDATRHLITGLKDLTSPNSRVRGSAAQSLGELGDRRAVIPLAQAATTDFAEGGEYGKVALTAVYALKDLAVERVPGALEALLELLQHPDGDHRSEVASAIGEVMDRRALAGLLAATRDPNDDVRSNTADALGKLGDPQAIPALIAMLDDPESMVASTAADALANLRCPETTASLIAALDRGLGDTAYQLASIPEPAVVAALVRGMRATSTEVRSACADALKDLADTFTEPMKSLGVPEAMRAALRDPDEGVRAPAAETLGKLRDAAAIEPLMARLRDTDWVREQTVVALGRIGDERACGALLTVLAEDGLGSVRAAAATALTGFAGAEVSQALLEALMDPEEATREKALVALGRREEPIDLEPLHRLATEDPEGTVRAAALTALGRIGTETSRAFLLAGLTDEAVARKVPIATTAGNALVALTRRGIPIIEPLVEMLAGADDTRTGRITAVFKQLRTEAVQPVLEAALRDPRGALRGRALVMLGEVAALPALAVLRAALTDPAPEVRARAAWALGNSGHRGAVAPLIAALADRTAIAEETVTPASWAAEALGKLRAIEAGPALCEAARSSDPVLREKAIVALGELPLPTAPPVLLEALRDASADIRCRAAQALGRLGDPAAITALSAALTDPAASSWGSDTVQRCAALALGDTRDRTATTPLLLAGLVSPTLGLRAASASALAALYESQAGPPILQALANRNLGDHPVAEYSAALQSILLPESYEKLAMLVYRDVAVADTLYALGRLADPRSFEPLRFAYVGQRKKHADTALWAMALCPGAEAFHFLVEQTRHDKAWTRGSAAYALGYRAEPAGAEALLRLTEDRAARGNHKVADCALDALGYLPMSASIDRRFREVLQTGDAAARRMVCAGLFWHGGTPCMASLRDLLAKNWQDPQATNWVPSAIYTLGANHDPTDVALLAEILGEAEPRYAVEALVSLGFLGAPAGEPLLRAWLDRENPWHRGAALIGLTLLGTPLDRTELRTRLAGEDVLANRIAIQLALLAAGEPSEPGVVEQALRADGWWATQWLALELPLPVERASVVRSLLRLLATGNINIYASARILAQLARVNTPLIESVRQRYSRALFPPVRQAVRNPEQTSRAGGRDGKR